MVFDFKLRVDFSDHGIVEVGSVVNDNPFGDSVLTYEVMLDKLGYNILGN